MRLPKQIKDEWWEELRLYVQWTPELVSRIEDTLSYIEQLEADNAQLNRCIENMTDKLNAAHDETAKMKAERDAAVADMYEAQGCLCLICKNHKPDPEKKKYICKAFGDYPFEDGPLICGKFEWRGAQKEESA